MVASTVKSVNITNIEAGSQTILEGKQGYIRGAIDTIEVATTSIDEIDDIILFSPIPSNAVLLDIQCLNDAIDTDGVLRGDFGLYYSGKGGDQASDTAKTSGTAIDVNNIATSSSVFAAANTSFASVRFEAADVAGIGVEAWELAGLSADPGGLFYIGFKVTTAATTPVAGTVTTLTTFLVN